MLLTSFSWPYSINDTFEHEYYSPTNIHMIPQIGPWAKYTPHSVLSVTKPVGRGGAWGAYAPTPFAQRSTLSIRNRYTLYSNSAFWHVRSERVTPTLKMRMFAHMLVSWTRPYSVNVHAQANPFLPSPFRSRMRVHGIRSGSQTTHMLTVLRGYVNQQCLNWSLCSYK